MLFDLIARNSTDIHPANEGRFTYLNRSGRPAAADVRAWLEQCFERYAYSDRETLRGRIRDADDTVHGSALFELIVHETLLFSGCRILAVEPSLAEGGDQPDFLVEDRDLNRFYVEAVVATGRTDRERRAERRRDDILQRLFEVQSPDWWLGLNHRGVPATQVSARSVVRDLSAWIADLPATADTEIRPFVRELDGMRIVVTASTPRNRPGEGRAFGATSSGIFMLRPGDGISQPLRRKMSKYRLAEHPVVIAANATGLSDSLGCFMAALFGTPSAIISSLDDDSSSAEASREDDGLWSQRTRGNGHISAVWAFKSCDGWNTASRTPTLIPNPWTARPLDHSWMPTNRIEIDPETGRYEQHDGLSLGALFGLEPSWPSEQSHQVSEGPQ